MAGRACIHPAVNLAEVKVVDDDFKEAPVGETGEIVVRPRRS
jgi:hypothetical protein